MNPRTLGVFAAFAAWSALAGPVHGQTTYNWAGSGGGGSTTTWLNVASWSGGIPSTWPGVTNTTNASNGNAGDIAQFTLSSNVTVGLNMNTAGGLFTLAAVSSTGTTLVPTIGNNSTTFFTNTTLQLNNSGSTPVAGFANVIMNNSNATSGTMTFQSFAAVNSPRMDIRLTSTSNVINVTNSLATITINSDIYEANPGTGFTLQGAGLLILAATGGSFSGPITVAGEGRLLVNNPAGLGTGTVTFNNATDKSGAANFLIGAPGNVTRTFANAFVLSGAGNSGFGISTSGSAAQTDTLSGVISGGAPGLKFALANSSFAAPSAFVLANSNNTFTATVSIGTGTVAITSDGALGNAANAVSLNVNNTLLGGLRFDANNISLAATRTVDVLTNSIVDTNGFNAKILGPVSNSGGSSDAFIKAGAGTLTLSGSADTLNNLTARQGTVVLDYTTNNNNKLDSAAAITLQGAALQMNANAAGSSQSFASVATQQGGSSALVATSNGGTGAVLNVGSLTRAVGSTLDFTPPAVGSIQTSTANGTTGLLFDGAMTVGQTDWATVSSGSVAAFNAYAFKNDASTFSAGDHISNNAAFSGTIPAGGLSIGSLRFNAAAAGGITIGAADALTIGSGGVGSILLTPAVTGTQSINGGSLTAGTELIVQHYGTGEFDIGSNITGSIAFTKSGPGRVVLAGNNTYSGLTVINQGTVSVASLTGTTNLGTGAITIGNGTLEYTGSASQSLPATRQITLTGVRGPNGATISVTNSAATLTILSATSGNLLSSLTKTGPGTLAINVSNANGYFGDTIVSNGTLTTNNVNGTGSTALTGRVILGDANTGSNNVAFLVALSSGTFPQPIIVSGQGTGTATVGIATGTAGGLVFASDISIGRAVTLQPGSSASVVFNNRITGTGDVIIGTQGTGSVTFTRGQGTNVASDWSGNLVLSPSATLVLGSTAGSANVDKSIPSTASVVFNTGSTLQLSPGTQIGYETVNALVSNSAATDGAIAQSTGTNPFQLTIGAGGGSGSFGGVISGPLALTKSGSGTQTLSGANTYSGITTVSGGTLTVNNTSGSGTGTGAVTVKAAGTLTGTGTISGATTVAGTIAPGTGNGSGTLTFSSPMTWAAGGSYGFSYSATTGLSAGVNYNTINSSSTLDVSQPTGVNPFTIMITPLASGTAGGGPVTYTLGSFANGITGFNAANFAFSGSYAGTPVVSLDNTGDLLQLTFTPVVVNLTAWTWTGITSGNWSTGSNWNPAGPPVGSPDLQLTFGATPNAAMTNDLAGTMALNAMTFNAGSPAYSLGGNGLSFQTSSGGASPQITQNSASGVTLNVPVTLTSNLTVSGPGSLTLSAAIDGPGGLTMAGSGTLTLSGTNSYTGGTAVNGGTVSVSADNALGTGDVTGGALGTLSFTGTTTTTKSFAMGGGTVAVTAGKTVTFDGSKVSNAYLDGAGTFATSANGARFVNVSSTASVAINSNSPADVFRNFTNSATLTVAPDINTSGASTNVTFNTFLNQGLGSVTVGASSEVNAANFQTFGSVTLAPGTGANPTLLTNVGGSPLGFNTGSRTFISIPSHAGAFDAGIDLHGQNAVVAGGLFVNNGYVIDSAGAGTKTVIADYGSLVKGAGFYQNSVQTVNGGKFQSGNSPGKSQFGNFTFGPGGVTNYQWQIDDPGPSPAFPNAPGIAGGTSNVTGQPDFGWSLIQAIKLGASPGNFTWTATAASPLTVIMQTLTGQTTVGNDVLGPMQNFDPALGYTWQIVTWAGTYSGPANAADLEASTIFDVTSGPFANSVPPYQYYHWILVDNGPGQGGSLYLSSAVPEPGSLCLLGAAGLAFGWARRRRSIDPGIGATAR